MLSNDQQTATEYTPTVQETTWLILCDIVADLHNVKQSLEREGKHGLARALDNQAKAIEGITKILGGKNEQHN